MRLRETVALLRPLTQWGDAALQRRRGAREAWMVTRTPPLRRRLAAPPRLPHCVVETKTSLPPPLRAGDEGVLSSPAGGGGGGPPGPGWAGCVSG